MLGPPKPRQVDRSVLVSLEALVPADHFYRQLERKLDLRFVRELVRDCYAPIGRPSIDPVIFFKLQLIMFFEGIRSERKLMEIARLHLAHRWYLGYALDEPLPDHSSLTRIRARLGLLVFRRFFDQIVELCQAAGLIWGKELFFDATKIEANAATDAVVPRLGKVVDDHIEALFPSGGLDAVVLGSAPAVPTARAEAQPTSAATEASPASPSPEAMVCLLPGSSVPNHVPPPAWNVLEQCRLDPNRPASGSYDRLVAARVSLTDPDAALMNSRTRGHASLGYHDHYVVDGGKARIILQALVTPADVMENQPMLDLLWRVRFRWHLHPKRAVADTKYATIDNIRVLEEAGIRAYMPLATWDRTPLYGPSRFVYDPAQDEYRCPQGQPLRRSRAMYDKEVWIYRADATTCNACPVKAAGTTTTQGRSLSRSFYAAYFDRVRQHHTTPAYQKAMRKRQVWIEPLFGEAKQWHGLRRFRLRGLAKVNMEGLFVAAGQNLKRWLAAMGRGRRHAPCGPLVSCSRSLSPRGGTSCVRLRRLRRHPARRRCLVRGAGRR